MIYIHISEILNVHNFNLGNLSIEKKFVRLRIDPQPLREASKKKFWPLRARPLRGGGGGVKAGPLRKKELFLKLFFLLCCHLKIKIILL